jgi:hypothetical protein
MVVAQVHKYFQCSKFREALLKTKGTDLVEASPTDVFRILPFTHQFNCDLLFYRFGGVLNWDSMMIVFWTETSGTDST